MQARSRIKVAAILAAAAHILKRQGLAGVTTNRIAETANISVGSVYQYFPNKESILLSLMRGHLETARRMRPPELDRSNGITLAERIQAAVRWHFDVCRRDPQMHRRLHEIHRDILTGEERAEFDRFHEGAVLAGLAHHRAEISQRDLVTAALVVSQFMIAATQVATAARPELLVDAEYEGSVVRAIVAYLTVESGSER